MKASDIPVKFPIPWANSAGVGFIRDIPTASQIGITDGAASLTDGSPPLNFLDQAVGGVPPFGQDTNGILKRITQWSRWLNAGATFNPYDSAFALSAAAGYPQGAIVASTTFGYFWLCTTDDNVSDPDAGGAGWYLFSLLGGATTGDLKFTIKTTADPGWLMINDGTLGSAASGASYASAVYQALYVIIWNSISNSFAPVTTGRGANAAADFAANKSMQMTRMLGRALALAGAGSGLTARALGQFLGEENHLLTLAEITAHNHVADVADPTHVHPLENGGTIMHNTGGGFISTAAPNQPYQQISTTVQAAATGVTVTTQNSGGGGSHNNMQPSTFLNAMVKI